MNSLSLPVVHPAFQKLKRSGRFLHLAAGGLILVHAISHFNQSHSSPVYIGCLLFMAVDIFILVVAGQNIAADMPVVNLFFRLIEVVFFFGISVTLILESRWFMGSIHGMVGLTYSYLFWCEKKLLHNERVGIHHSGISLPSLPGDRFLVWTQIDRIEAQYDSITINTSEPHSYHFDLRENLQFEELDQIHEFCRHYLGT